MQKTAVFTGRFQPFNNVHLQIIRELKKKYNKILVGIFVPENIERKENIFDKDKFSKENNPFSYEQISGMIARTADVEVFRFYPPNLYSFEKFKNNFPSDIKDAGFIVPNGDEKKIERLKSLGLNYSLIDKIQGVSSSEIREMIKAGNEKWKEFVPKEVVEVINNIGAGSSSCAKIK